MTTLGIAGLLLAALPGIGLPSGASTGAGAPREQQYLSAGSDAGGGAGSPTRLPVTAPEATTGGDMMGRPVYGTDSEPAPTVREDRGVGAGPAPDPADVASLREPAGPSALVVLSGSFLIVGLGLYGIRWTARRFGGPG